MTLMCRKVSCSLSIKRISSSTRSAQTLIPGHGGEGVGKGGAPGVAASMLRVLSLSVVECAWVCYSLEPRTVERAGEAVAVRRVDIRALAEVRLHGCVNDFETAGGTVT